MHLLEPIPPQIESVLKSKGVNLSSLHLLISSDVTLSGEFEQAWLGVDDTFLYILRPAEPNHNGFDESSHAAWKLETIPLTTIEKAHCINMAGNGLFVLSQGGEDHVVARFSNSAAKRFGTLAKITSKIAQGESVSEDDFYDERQNTTCPKCGRLYPDQNRRVCPHCIDRRTIFRRVLGFVPQYKRQIALILFFMLCGVVLNLVSPFVGGRVLFDEVLQPGGRYEGRLLEMVLVMAAVQLLSLLTSIAHARMNAQMTAQVICDLKTEVYAAMQRLSLGFFASKQTGSLMTRVNSDAMHLQYFFHDGLPYFIVNSLQLIAIVATMLLMNWKLALFLLIPVPAIVFFVNRAYPKLWRLFTRRHMKTRALNAVLNDTLTGVRVVKAFGREEAEIYRFGERNLDMYEVSLQEGNYKATLFPLMSLLMSLGGFIVWSVGGAQVLQGELTFGTLMTFIGYLGMLYGPLEFMTHIVDWWTSCMNSAQRIFELLDAEPDVAEAPNPVPMPRIRGEVELENVTFEYEPNRPVLHNINLHIRAGEVIGLVGRSGAGKSTIINLITRLYDVTEGSIRIDGVDVRDIRIADLRSQIGIVLQEPYLFHGSIAENIAYAKPDASPEEIIRAAKMANAHDFIVKLPDGYDTVIGRRGHNLSGGERQRVSIARAILHNPRILILDEATASVDTETEQKIQEALERLVEGRTTIVIAHRLSTLRNANRIVVVDKGRIVEVGTHAELEAAKGAYYELLEKQREALKIGVKIA